MQIPVQIDVKGQSILGMLHMPEKRAIGLPVIIMCYGFNGNRVENNRMSVFCGRLAEESGVAFFRFDYRGLGISEGEFWNTSIRTKTDDVLAVIDYLKGCFRGEKINIIALGFSDGTRIITNLIGSCTDIKGMCLWSPILFPIVDEVHGKPARRLIREPVTKELVMPFRGLWVGREYLKQQADIGNEYNRLKNFEKSRMAIFGGSDPTVTETYEKLVELRNSGHENISIMTIPNADHLYSRAEWAKKVINITLDWALKVGRNNAD